MKEERTGGGREFVFSVLWAAALFMAGRGFCATLDEYKIAGMLITILMYCVLGFYVLTRYAAVYTLTLSDDGYVHIARAIGHRIKAVDFSLTQVRSVQRTRPRTGGRAQVMRQTVFSRCNVFYIEYEKNGVVSLLECDMSRDFADRIKKEL